MSRRSTWGRRTSQSLCWTSPCRQICHLWHCRHWRQTCQGPLHSRKYRKSTYVSKLLFNLVANDNSTSFSLTWWLRILINLIYDQPCYPLKMLTFRPLHTRREQVYQALNAKFTSFFQWYPASIICEKYLSSKCILVLAPVKWPL